MEQFITRKVGRAEKSFSRVLYPIQPSLHSLTWYAQARYRHRLFFGAVRGKLPRAETPARINKQIQTCSGANGLGRIFAHTQDSNTIQHDPHYPGNLGDNGTRVHRMLNDIIEGSILQHVTFYFSNSPSDAIFVKSVG